MVLNKDNIKKELLHELNDVIDHLRYTTEPKVNDYLDALVEDREFDETKKMYQLIDMINDFHNLVNNIK